MKLKRLSMVFATCVLFAAFATISASAADFAGGSGTKADPYLISETTHLNNVRKDLDAYYQMIDDIAFEEEDFTKDGDFYNNGAGWKPIGSTAAPFTGTFDGDGCTITGLTLTFNKSSTSTTEYTALFGYVKGGTIENVTLAETSMSVTGSLNNEYTVYTGILAAYANDATIQNCSVDGTLSVNCYVSNYSNNPGLQLYTGGLVGYLDGASSCIEACSNSAAISVTSRRDTYSRTYAYTGGIVGCLDGGCIDGCSNYGEITTAVSDEKGTANWSDRVGGIAGYAMNDPTAKTTISLSRNTAALSGPELVGGIVGRAGAITVERCYNTGTLTGKDTAGGIAADSSAATIQNCYNCGEVRCSWSYNQGGIVGFAENETTTITACYNVGSVGGASTRNGGILGYNYYDDAVFSYCFYRSSGSLPGVGAGADNSTSKRSDAEMKLQKTFTPGFDFEDIWTMDGSPDYPYPELQGFEVEAEEPELTEITIDGDNEAAIPTRKSITVTLTATAAYDDGTSEDVTEDAEWSVVDEPDDVDVSAGVVKIWSSAEAGSVTIKAVYDGETATHIIILTKANEGVLAVLEIEGRDDLVAPVASGAVNHYSYEVSGEDPYGDKVKPSTVTWSIKETVAGVTIDPATGELSVTSAAESGTVTIQATADGVTGEKTVTIVKPSAEVSTLTITGETTVAVPEFRDETDVELTAIAYYQDDTNETVTDLAEWSIVDGEPEGVEISSDGCVTIESDAAAGTVKIQAVYNGKTAIHTLTLTKEGEGVLVSLDIDGEDEIAVPTKIRSPLTEQYSVIGKDKYGEKVQIKEGTITWSIDGKELTGISIDDQTGELSVTSEAVAGRVTITVADKNGNTDEIKVKISKDDPVFTSLEITGTDPKLMVPAVDAIGGSSSDSVENPYTVLFYDQYGNGMDEDTVTWSVSGNSGVEINPETGELTIKNTATNDRVTITASCNGKSDSRTVSVIKADVDLGAFIRILKNGTLVTEDLITIPTSGSTSEVYVAEIYNRYGERLTEDTPVWHIDSAAGVSVSGGTVTVETEAAGTSTPLTLIAVSSTNEKLNAEVFITLYKLPTHQITAFNDAAMTVTYGDDVTGQTVTSTTGTVKYSSSDSSSVEVDETSGELTIHKATTAPVTVTATVAEIPGQYAQNTASYTITVNPKQLTVINLTAVDRAYAPANTSVVLQGGELDGVVGTDDVSAAMPTSGTIDTPDVGEKTVAVTKPELTGADAANYTLADITGITVTISKATPDIGAVTKSSPETIYTGTLLSGITLSRGNTSVEGTLALDGDQALTVGAKDYNWTFTPSDVNNYNSVTGTIELTVEKDILTDISISGNPDKTTYQYGETFDPAGLTVIATYASGATKVLPTGEYTVSNGTMTMGQTTVTLSYTEDDVTKTCDVTGLTVTKAKLDVSIMTWDTTGSPFTYDGSEKTVSLIGTLPAGVTVEKTGYQATLVDEYTASAAFSLAVGYSSDCYEVTGTNPLTADWKIEKADYSGTASTTVNIVKNRSDAQSGTLNADDFFDVVPAGAKITAVTPASGAMMSSVSVDADGNLSYVSHTRISSTGDESYTVTISSDNYNDITNATLIFHPTEKDPAGVSISGTPDSVTYGDEDFTLTGHVSEAGIGTGTWTWTSSDPSVLQIVGSGDTVTVKVLKSGTAIITAKYESETTVGEGAPVSIPVSKALVTVTAKDRTIYVNGTVPNLSEPVEGIDYTVSGLVGSDTLNVVMEYQKNGEGMVPDQTKAGNYDIVIVHTTIEQEKYDVQSIDGTLMIKTRSSGNHSSSEATYAIIVKDSSHGDVTADHKRAPKGEKIILTIEADKGYTLETLIVTDQNGKQIQVKEKNGNYFFTMPASKVTVEATFMEDNSMLNFFVDVPADAYFRDAVLWAAENGITSGTDAVHFSPNAACTRAQAVTFLWRTAGCPAPQDRTMPFTDVAANAYYYDAVLWAVENGITNGTTDITFSPNAVCSRAQIVTFLWRFQNAPSMNSMNPFVDVSAGTYYIDAVLWAVESGITNGVTATSFAPNNNCTRAQIVTFLYRCMK